LDDVYSDFEYCTDLRQHFRFICSVLNIKDLLPKQRIGHRWLNILECCERFLKDALTVFYFSFLSVSDKHLYQKEVVEILQKRNVPSVTRTQVYRTFFKVEVQKYD